MLQTDKLQTDKLQTDKLQTNKLQTNKGTEQYLKTLSEKEMKSYLIAKSHLGTSFQLDKSVGFLKWKAANNY